MFLGHSIPVSVYQSQLKTGVVFTSAATLYRNFLSIPQLNPTAAPNVRVGPDLRFTRNSGASIWTSLSTMTYVVSGIPRFNYTYNGTLQGLLVEEARANFIPWSSDYTRQDGWRIVVNPGNSAGVALTGGVITAPDGELSATLMRENLGAGFHTLSWVQGTETESKEIYARSIFVKKETARYIAIGSAATPFSDNVTRVFDFDAPGFVAGSLIGAEFETVNNGWYRLNFSRASTNGNTNKLCIGICSGPAVSAAQYTPNPFSLSGVYIWGAQVERGDQPTSYIPTSGSAVIRDADRVELEPSGVKNVYNEREGTFYIDQFRKEPDSPASFAAFINRFSSQYWTLQTLANPRAVTFLVSGSNIAFNTINSPVHNPLISNRTTVGLGRDNTTMYFNRTFVRTLTSIVLPTQVVRFQLGNAFENNYLNGHIRVFGYWPKRFTNSTLATMSGQSVVIPLTS